MNSWSLRLSALNMFFPRRIHTIEDRRQPAQPRNSIATRLATRGTEAGSQHHRQDRAQWLAHCCHQPCLIHYPLLLQRHGGFQPTAPRYPSAGSRRAPLPLLFEAMQSIPGLQCLAVHYLDSGIGWRDKSRAEEAPRHLWQRVSMLTLNL